MSTEQGTEPGSSSAGTDRTDERPDWAEDLKSEILGAVRDMLGGARAREREHLTDPAQSKSGRAEQAGADLDQQIDAAVARVTAAKEREAREAGDRQRLDALEAAAAERPPVERTVLHRAMRWGEPAP